MAIPTVYRWDDLNAPVIDDNKDWDQIKDWYDKIFVTGYMGNDGWHIQKFEPWLF